MDIQDIDKEHNLSSATLKTFTRNVIKAYTKTHHQKKKKDIVRRQVSKIKKLSEDRLIDRPALSKEVSKLAAHVSEIIDNERFIVQTQKQEELTHKQLSEKLMNIQKEMADIKIQLAQVNQANNKEYVQLFPETELKKIVKNIERSESTVQQEEAQHKQPSELEIKAIEEQIRRAENYYNAIKVRSSYANQLDALKNKLETQKLKLKNLKRN